MQKPEWIQRTINRHRLFIVGIFIFAALAHTPYLAPGGPSVCFPWPLSFVSDEGTVLYDSFRITCGEVIYRDFFQFQGPVFYYVYAGLFAVTGPSIAAARALNLLITALTATFIALIIAQSLGSVTGAAAAAIHVCLLVPMWPYAYPHWLAEAFAFWGIYLLLRGGGRPRHIFASGAFLGLSAATIQSLGLPILAACMVVLAILGIVRRSWRKAFVHPLLLLMGALLGIVPFITYLGMVGALDDMWHAMFKWAFTHYPEGQKDAMMQGYGAFLTKYLIFHGRIGQPWRGLALTGLQFVSLLPVFTICGVIVATVQIIINRWRQSVDYGYLMIGIAAIAGTAPLLLKITRTDMVHIAFVGSFGLCSAAIALQPLGTWKPRFRLPVTILWAFFGLLAIANFSAKTVMTYQPSREMQGWREEILKLGLGNWIDTNLGPNERIVTAYGGLQYLYIRRAAVGFTYLPFNTPKYYSDEQWRKIGGQILETLPPVIEVTKEQWLQMTERTPELIQRYQLYNIHSRYVLLSKGFSPRD